MPICPFEPISGTDSAARITLLAQTSLAEMYLYRDMLKDTVLGSNAVKDRRRRKVQQLISFKPTTSRLKGVRSSTVPQLLPHWTKRYDRAEVQLSIVSVSHPGPTSKYPTGDFR